MIALIVIIFFTALGVFIGIYLSPEVTWYDYYKGGMGGLFFSAILLYFSNKRRRAKELEEERDINRPRKSRK